MGATSLLLRYGRRFALENVQRLAPSTVLAPSQRGRVASVIFAESVWGGLPTSRDTRRLARRTRKGRYAKLLANFVGSFSQVRFNLVCQSSPSHTRPLIVRPDAVKRHLESKTCISKRKKGDDEDPYLSES